MSADPNRKPYAVTPQEKELEAACRRGEIYMVDLFTGERVEDIEGQHPKALWPGLKDWLAKPYSEAS